MDPRLRGYADIRRHVERTPGRPTVVTDSSRLLAHLVVVDSDPLEARVLTRTAALEVVTDVAYLRWAIATGTADDLAIFHERTTHGAGVVLEADRVVALLEYDGGIAGLPGRDRTLVGAIRRWVDRHLEAAARYDPEGPTIEAVADALDEHLGGAVRTAVLDAVAAGWRARLEGAGPPALEVVLLAAAHHDRLLRDVGDWAVAVGLTSRGEVSRAKDRLVDAGLVETTAVVDGEGRPPLRLHLDAPALRRSPPEAYGRVAAAILDEG